MVNVDYKEQVRKIRMSNLLAIATAMGSISALAKRVGRAHSQLNDMIRGRKTIGDKVISDIEKKLGLVQGSLSVQKDSELLYLPPSTFKSRSIPVIGCAQAGQPTDRQTNVTEEIYISSDCPISTIAVEVQGESMLPTLSAGDIVLVDSDRIPKAGDIVIAVNNDEKFFTEATIKRYAITGLDDNGNEKFELRPDNNLFPTLRSIDMSLKIIGVVFELRKRL